MWLIIKWIIIKKCMACHSANWIPHQINLTFQENYQNWPILSFKSLKNISFFFLQFQLCMENHSARCEEFIFQIGDTIQAKGVLYDFKDTLSFYAYNIRILLFVNIIYYYYVKVFYSFQWKRWIDKSESFHSLQFFLI